MKRLPIYVAVLCQGVLLASQVSAGFISSLDDVSTASTFQIGAGQTDYLPALGWSNVSGAAMIWNQTGLNGSLIESDRAPSRFGDFTVQFSTSTPIAPNTQYTLHFDMGYVADLNKGTDGYSFSIGVVDNHGAFTPLGAPATGTVTWAGNMNFFNHYSGSADQVYTTGPTVPAEDLAVRWSQTSSNLGSDFFGFDNVTLDATPAVGTPEPSSLILSLLALIGIGWRRARLRS